MALSLLSVMDSEYSYGRTDVATLYREHHILAELRGASGQRRTPSWASRIVKRLTSKIVVGILVPGRYSSRS